MAFPDSEIGRERLSAVFLSRPTLGRAARILALPVAFWRA
jgi:hypothetical protein